MEWREGGGLRDLLTRLERYAFDVAGADEFIHMDIDRPDDYRRITDRLEGHEIFSWRIAQLC